MDDKGRIIFPAKFRNNLGNHPVMTRGIGGCIYVFTGERWAEIEKKLSQREALDPDAILIQRFLAGGATEIGVDNQGRVAIPQNLRQYAGIRDNVTVMGLTDKIEIWDTQRYEEMMSGLTMERIAAAARNIGLAGPLGGTESSGGTIAQE